MWVVDARSTRIWHKKPEQESQGELNQATSHCCLCLDRTSSVGQVSNTQTLKLRFRFVFTWAESQRLSIPLSSYFLSIFRVANYQFCIGLNWKLLETGPHRWANVAFWWKRKYRWVLLIISQPRVEAFVPSGTTFDRMTSLSLASASNVKIIFASLPLSLPTFAVCIWRVCPRLCWDDVFCIGLFSSYYAEF